MLFVNCVKKELHKKKIGKFLKIIIRKIVGNGTTTLQGLIATIREEVQMLFKKNYIKNKYISKNNRNKSNTTHIIRLIL